jgi:hypothetical protein
MMTGMKLSLSQKRIVSLENLDEFEEKLVVNTPRSLEACFKEGVEPEELFISQVKSFNSLDSRLEYKNCITISLNLSEKKLYKQ